MSTADRASNPPVGRVRQLLREGARGGSAGAPTLDALLELVAAGARLPESEERELVLLAGRLLDTASDCYLALLAEERNPNGVRAALELTGFGMVAWEEFDEIQQSVSRVATGNQTGDDHIHHHTIVGLLALKYRVESSVRAPIVFAPALQWISWVHPGPQLFFRDLDPQQTISALTVAYESMTDGSRVDFVRHAVSIPGANRHLVPLMRRLYRLHRTDEIFAHWFVNQPASWDAFRSLMEEAEKLRPVLRGQMLEDVGDRAQLPDPRAQVQALATVVSALRTVAKKLEPDPDHPVHRELPGIGAEISALLYHVYDMSAEEARDAVAAGIRVVRFPGHRQLGQLFIGDSEAFHGHRDTDLLLDRGWKPLENVGDTFVVSGSAGVGLRLGYPSDSDLSVLATLAPDTLQALDLSSHRWSDEDLVHVRGLTGLKYLNLSGRDVTDRGLEHLRGLTSLLSLDLNYTAITDAGLAHLRDLAGLLSLDLASTAITDAGLEHLRGLTSLQALNLRNTGVGNAGLAPLRGLTSLRTLTLEETAIGDDGLEHIAGLTNLTWLDLSETRVTDDGLRRLSGLTALEFLFLNDTGVTDEGLIHLQGLASLEGLQLFDTATTKAGRAALQEALPGSIVAPGAT